MANKHTNNTLTLAVNGKKCDNMKEFEDKARKGFEAIGEIQSVETGGHEILGLTEMGDEQ